MPKLIISRENFIEVNAYTGSVFLRYRLISEDKNRKSYWSPVFEVEPPVYYVQGTLDVPGGLLGFKSSGYVTLAWDSVKIYGNEEYNLADWGVLPAYDVWIQFTGNNGVNAGPWLYKERVFSTSLNIIVPPSYNYTNASGNIQSATPRQMKIELHRSAKPITRYSPDRIIFLQGPSGVDLVNNTVYFPEGHGLTTGDAVGYYVYNSSSAMPPLADGQVYWVRSIDNNHLSFYTTQQDSIDDTNRIDILSYGENAGVLVSRPFLQSSSINTTTDIITVPYDHNFKTGDSVIYNALTAAAPLVKETLYWVRPVTAQSFSIHSSRAGAITNTGKIDLTNTGSGYASLARFSTLLYKTTVGSL
jgi:hypothetical protein